MRENNRPHPVNVRGGASSSASDWSDLPSVGDDTRKLEQVTLGLAMQSREYLDQIRELVEPMDFYSHYDIQIFRNLCLHADLGEPMDPEAIYAALIKSGVKLPHNTYLIDLWALGTRTSGTPDWYARQVAQASETRQLLLLAANIKDAVSAGNLDRARTLANRERPEALTDGHGWQIEDITDVLAGSRDPVLPEIGHRQDGVPLLYRGKEHAIAGEPESGKTWFALMCVVDVLKLDGRVTYVDFEDDAATVVGRLLDLGVLPKRLRADTGQFRYVRPDAPPEPKDVTRLATFPDGPADLLVYDGWTEGAALAGLNIIDGSGQGDVATWRQRCIKPALTLGTATLTTDHVVKNKEARGRYGIGAQHKLAGLTGIQFMIDVVETWGRGSKGRSKILISKDRNGGLRPHGKRDDKANLTHIGDLVGDATSGEMRSLVLWPPFDDEDGEDLPPAKLRPAVEKIRKTLEGSAVMLSGRELHGLVKGNKGLFDEALVWLRMSGGVVTESGPNNSILHGSATSNGR